MRHIKPLAPRMMANPNQKLSPLPHLDTVVSATLGFVSGASANFVGNWAYGRIERARRKKKLEKHNIVSVGFGVTKEVIEELTQIKKRTTKVTHTQFFGNSRKR